MANVKTATTLLKPTYEALEFWKIHQISSDIDN